MAHQRLLGNRSTEKTKLNLAENCRLGYQKGLTNDARVRYQKKDH